MAVSIESLQIVPVTYESDKLGTSVFRMFGGDSIYSLENGVDESYTRWYVPRNEISDIWFTQKETQSHPWNVTRYANRLTYKTNPSAYWNALDSTVDPLDYIKLLKLYKPGGICLAQYRRNFIPSWQDYPKGRYERSGLEPQEEVLRQFISSMGDCPHDGSIPVNGCIITKDYPQGKYIGDPVEFAGNWAGPVQGLTVYTVYTRLMPARRDRARYDLYIKRIREVLNTYFVNKTKEYLAMSRLQDLQTAKDSLTMLINREIPQFIRELDAAIPVQVIRQDNNQLQPVVYCNLPDDFLNGPEIKYDGVSYTARAALIKEIQDASSIMLANANDIAASIAQYSDPVTVIPREDIIADPYESPFVVYDPDINQFRNIAANLTKNWETGQVVTPDPGTVPLQRHYELAPDIIASHLRTIDIEGGGRVSPDDLRKLQTEKDVNIIPWLAGGVAVAAILTQVMG